PLRRFSGTSLVSPAELAADAAMWRAEWVRRRKILYMLWQLATDPLPPQEVAESEELGVERDTPEHAALERGMFSVSGILSKRRR
ncbi:hypothetical protein C8Q72DRAFT_787522, partial [Fomitopsis betulina]